MANLTDWANAVAGRYIDVDSWEGNQCWDLSQHWLTTCNGGTLWTQPSRFPGMAAGSWEVATQNTANTTDLLRHVTAHPGTERGLPGDIVIWAYGSPSYPISHTAVLLEDRGPILRTLSQNSSPARPDLRGYSDKSSGPTIHQDLTRAGILGFLRPRTTITGQSTGFETIQEDDMTPEQEAKLDNILGYLAKGGPSVSAGEGSPLSVFGRVIDMQTALTSTLPQLMAMTKDVQLALTNSLPQLMAKPGTAVDVSGLAKALAGQLEARDLAALASQLQVTVRDGSK
ncbi:hypothetical protein AOC05_04885 [Arthrobacter alpinus]|uniref:Uncharacterized protein n=1 Tax=Arthrobacter alpinus TaxID=656366 RepID=A0A0M3UFY1_9MICC|nr:hypothetical protein [Arthrobacter alpinus]ALE91809.1 hypothetical protein AOC05_04885 [Arthrobacter alpinus]